MQTGRFFTNRQSYDQLLSDLNYQQTFQLFNRLVKQFELAINAQASDAVLLGRLEQLFYCLVRGVTLPNEVSQVIKSDYVRQAEQVFARFSRQLDASMQLPLKFYTDMCQAILKGLLERSTTFKDAGQAITSLLAKDDINSVLKTVVKGDWLSPIILVSSLKARCKHVATQRQLLAQLVERLQPFKCQQWHVHYAFYLAWKDVFAAVASSEQRQLFKQSTAGVIGLNYMLGLESKTFYCWRSTRKRSIRKVPLIRCAQLWFLTELLMLSASDAVNQRFLEDAKIAIQVRERQEGYTDFDVGYLFDNADECALACYSADDQVPVVRPVLSLSSFAVPHVADSGYIHSSQDQALSEEYQFCT